VGANLTRALLNEGAATIRVVDNLLSSERFLLPEHPAVRFVHGSITDDAVLSGIRDEYEHVFHLATFHGNQNSMHDPTADLENNILPTLKLCEHLKGFSGLRSLVYSSAGCAMADKTFATPQATPEDAPLSLFLDSPYQISKIVGELHLNYYFTQYGLPAVKARFQNVYGPGEVLGAGAWRGTSATVWRNVVPTFIYRALMGLPLELHDAGRPTRDFIHVDDIVQGLLLCALKGRSGETYNLASGVETSIRELAEIIIAATESHSDLRLLPPRDWDHAGRRFGSTEKSWRELGFSCRIELQRGLSATVAWTRENLSRIQACIAAHANHMAAEESSRRIS